MAVDGARAAGGITSQARLSEAPVSPARRCLKASSPTDYQESAHANRARAIELRLECAGPFFLTLVAAAIAIWSVIRWAYQWRYDGKIEKLEAMLKLA